MEKRWRQYEEDVAAFYRTLGLEAETQVKLQGARALHEVDVVVRFDVHGVAVTWVVECKDWTRAVPKERVLALDSIVKDVGADHGILVAESGFQAGAIQFAQQNNLTLTSLEVLRESSTAERFALTVRTYQERIIQIALAAKYLWTWTAPGRDDSVLTYGSVLEIAAVSFELQNMVLPRLPKKIGSPFVLSFKQNHAAIDSEAELTAFLGPPLQKVEQDIDTAVSSIENAKSNASKALQGLTKEIASLVSLGRLFSAGQRDEDASAFGSAMRQVDSEAELLKNSTPTEVGRAVRKLMHFLVDSTYVVVQDVNPDWDSQAARLDSLLAKIREQLKLA